MMARELLARYEPDEMALRRLEAQAAQVGERGASAALELAGAG
jgi:hypothetical protein